MKYISLDIETTGLSPECDVLEVAMVLEDASVSPLPPISELPCINVLFRRDFFHGEPYALDMHMKSGLFDLCQQEGVPEKDAWATILAWLKGLGSGQWVVAGKNVAGFDIPFFPPEIRARFSHRTIDPGSIYIDWDADKPPSLGDLKTRMNVPGNVAHRALEDARDVIHILRNDYP